MPLEKLRCLPARSLGSWPADCRAFARELPLPHHAFARHHPSPRPGLASRTSLSPRPAVERMAKRKGHPAHTGRSSLFYKICGEQQIIRRVNCKLKKTQSFSAARRIGDRRSLPSTSPITPHFMIIPLGQEMSPNSLEKEPYSLFLATRKTSSIVVMPSKTLRMPSS
jgi:hypothetical protein